MVFSAHGADGAGEEVSGGRDGDGDRPRAADDSRRQAASVAREVDARDVAAHGVAEEDVGRVCGNLAADQLPQPVLVLYQGVCAAARRKASVPAWVSGAAVANVVVSADDEPPRAEEARKLVVAAHVLAHAVDHLHHGARGGQAVPLG